MNSRYRVLIAKPGLDGHDRGAKVIATALRDAGFEVIYSGLHQTPRQIVHTAIQEDVGAIGISILSGAHLELTKRIFDELHETKIEGIKIFLGGVIPAADIPVLLELGVSRVFSSGTNLLEVTTWLTDELSKEFR